MAKLSRWDPNQLSYFTRNRYSCLDIGTCTSPNAQAFNTSPSQTRDLELEDLDNIVTGCPHSSYVNHDWGCFWDRDEDPFICGPGDAEGDWCAWEDGEYDGDCDEEECIVNPDFFSDDKVAYKCQACSGSWYLPEDEGYWDTSDISCCLTEFPKVWFNQYISQYPGTQVCDDGTSCPDGYCPEGSGTCNSMFGNWSAMFTYVEKDGQRLGNQGPSGGNYEWDAEEDFNEDSPNPFDNPIVGIFGGRPFDKQHCCGIDDGVFCTQSDTDCDIRGLSPMFWHNPYLISQGDEADDVEDYPGYVCDAEGSSINGVYCDCDFYQGGCDNNTGAPDYGCRDPETGQVYPCKLNVISPPTVMQMEVDDGRYGDAIRHLNADTPELYPYPHTPNGTDTSTDLIFALPIYMTTGSPETFTVKVYDPSLNEFRVVGCYTINGVGDSFWLGTPNLPMTLSYTDSGDVVGCMDPNSVGCNYNCSATIPCDDCCEYPDENCSGVCGPDGETQYVDWYRDCDGDAFGCETNMTQACWPIPPDVLYCNDNPPVTSGVCEMTGDNCVYNHPSLGDEYCDSQNGGDICVERILETGSLCDCDGSFDDCNVCNGDNTDCNSDTWGTDICPDMDCEGSCFGDVQIDSCGECGGIGPQTTCYEDVDGDGFGACGECNGDVNCIQVCDTFCPDGWSLVGGDSEDCDQFPDCNSDFYFIDECGVCAPNGQDTSPFLGCADLDGDGGLDCFGCPDCSVSNVYNGYKNDDCDECMSMQCVIPCVDGVQTYFCSDDLIEYNDLGACESACDDTCVELCDMGCLDGDYENDISCNGNYMVENPCSIFDSSGSWPEFIVQESGRVPKNENWNSSCVDCKGYPPNHYDYGNTYDITCDERIVNCCKEDERDVCGVCTTAHGDTGGYVIEGTDNSTECLIVNEECVVKYYDGPLRWYPDADDDGLGYGIWHPAGPTSAFCGQMDNGCLLPGTKPTPTGGIDDYVYECSSIEQILDGYGNQRCLDDEGAEECASNEFDACGICDGPDTVIPYCGCFETPPINYCMDLDGDGVGYGYWDFESNVWNSAESAQLCEQDIQNLDNPADTCINYNPLWVECPTNTDTNDINVCVDPEASNYYCTRYRVPSNYHTIIPDETNCVCDMFASIPESIPDDNGLPTAIFGTSNVGTTNGCKYLEIIYPCAESECPSLHGLSNIPVKWNNDDSGLTYPEWYSGEIYCGDFPSNVDAKFIFRKFDSNTPTYEFDSPLDSSVVDWEFANQGLIASGTYILEIFYPSTSYQNDDTDLEAYASVQIEILDPIYGCMDDGNKEYSPYPNNCCNPNKPECSIPMTFPPELGGGINTMYQWVFCPEPGQCDYAEECREACNYNSEAVADDISCGCQYPSNWYSDYDFDGIPCCDETAGLDKCGPLSACCTTTCGGFGDLPDTDPPTWIKGCEDGEVSGDCTCPAQHAYDRCNICMDPCCGSPGTVCVDTDGVEYNWAYNGLITSQGENPCSPGELPGNPLWNTSCAGCMDIDAANYVEGAIVGCSGKCNDDVSPYWSDECDTNYTSAFVCSGRCGDNVFLPCLSDEDCIVGSDNYGSCVFGTITSDLYINYYGTDSYDNQGLNCCCEYDEGCVDSLAPNFGYNCPMGGCKYDCAGNPTSDCLFNWGVSPIPSAVVLYQDNTTGSETFLVKSLEADGSAWTNIVVGMYLRINNEVVEVKEVGTYPDPPNSYWTITVERGIFQTLINGHLINDQFYLENNTCINDCCAHYNISACTDRNAFNFYCYGELGYGNIDYGLCPDYVGCMSQCEAEGGDLDTCNDECIPDTDQVSVIPCTSDTYSNIQDCGNATDDNSATDYDCCCDLKYDCVGNVITPENITPGLHAYIDDCGNCVGPGTSVLDTVLDQNGDYVCGQHPDGGTPIDCSKNYANMGCGCYHPVYSPHVFNPRNIYIENINWTDNLDFQDTPPAGWEKQLVWYLNSDNDGYGCFDGAEGSYPSISWYNQEASWKASYPNYGDSIRINPKGYIDAVNGTDTYGGFCISDNTKACWDEQGNIACPGATEEEKRADCSTYIYSWRYCYQPPNDMTLNAYISEICTQDDADGNSNLPYFIANDSSNPQSSFCNGRVWIGWEYQDTPPGESDTYGDLMDWALSACNCTGSPDAEGTGLDGEGYSGPGYFDCNNQCMGPHRLDACGFCYDSSIGEAPNPFCEEGVEACPGQQKDCNGVCYSWTPEGILSGLVDCVGNTQCDLETETNSFLDDCGVCSGGNTGHYPNKIHSSHDEWPFPYSDNTQFRPFSSAVNQLENVPDLMLMGLSESFPGHGIFGGPELDCVGHCNVEVTNLCGNVTADGGCEPGEWGGSDPTNVKWDDPGEALVVASPGWLNPYTWENIGMDCDPMNPTHGSCAFGMTCGCTRGRTYRPDNWCAGCAIQFDPMNDTDEARNFNGMCDTGMYDLGVYLSDDCSGGYDPFTCPWGCGDDNECLGYGGYGEPCIIDNGTCTFCECGHDANFDLNPNLSALCGSTWPIYDPNQPQGTQTTCPSLFSLEMNTTIDNEQYAYIETCDDGCNCFQHLEYDPKGTCAINLNIHGDCQWWFNIHQNDQGIYFDNSEIFGTSFSGNNGSWSSDWSGHWSIQQYLPEYYTQTDCGGILTQGDGHTEGNSVCGCRNIQWYDGSVCMNPDCEPSQNSHNRPNDGTHMVKNMANAYRSFQIQDWGYNNSRYVWDARHTFGCTACHSSSCNDNFLGGSTVSYGMEAKKWNDSNHPSGNYGYMACEGPWIPTAGINDEDEPYAVSSHGGDPRATKWAAWVGGQPMDAYQGIPSQGSTRRPAGPDGGWNNQGYYGSGNIPSKMQNLHCYESECFPDRVSVVAGWSRESEDEWCVGNSPEVCEGVAQTETILRLEDHPIRDMRECSHDFWSSVDCWLDWGESSPFECECEWYSATDTNWRMCSHCPQKSCGGGCEQNVCYTEGQSCGDGTICTETLCGRYNMTDAQLWSYNVGTKHTAVPFNRLFYANSAGVINDYSDTQVWPVKKAGVANSQDDYPGSSSSTKNWSIVNFGGGGIADTSCGYDGETDKCTVQFYQQGIGENACKHIRRNFLRHYGIKATKHVPTDSWGNESTDTGPGSNAYGAYNTGAGAGYYKGGFVMFGDGNWNEDIIDYGGQGNNGSLSVNGETVYISRYQYGGPNSKEILFPVDGSESGRVHDPDGPAWTNVINNDSYGGQVNGWKCTDTCHSLWSDKTWALCGHRNPWQGCDCIHQCREVGANAGQSQATLDATCGTACPEYDGDAPDCV